MVGADFFKYHMKMFDNNGLGWTKQATELTDETLATIRPIFDKWCALGYSVRDIAHIINWAVNDAEIDYVMETKLKEGKENGK